MEQPYGAPKVTKDGVTVAKHIEFADHFMNMGAQLVRQVSNRTNDVAGDGTTTATVLARAIYAEGVKSVATGMNPMDIKRGIDAAVRHVLKDLKEQTKMITSKEEIAQVATISANGETEIGELIADAMEKVGREGVITCQDGRTLENELEVVEGMRFDRGYISPFFVTDPKVMKCDLEDALLYIHEKKISSMQQIVPVMELAIKSNKNLVVVAEDIDSDALTTLIVNRVRGSSKVCLSLSYHLLPCVTACRDRVRRLEDWDGC